MDFEIISYHELMDSDNNIIAHKIKSALFQQGIVGIKNVPHFMEKMRNYLHAARQFSHLSETIKKQYAPNRDAGETEGYELGAEWFKDANGKWHIDDKKASFYAFVPDHACNKWPQEVDLKTPYLELGKLIFAIGKHVLNFIGLNHNAGIAHEDLVGYGRMLHYHKETDSMHINPHWCGAHFDHGVFTGLAPAFYFKEGEEIAEPEEAGLFIKPTHQNQFIKINSSDKDILLFQAGEFGQLAMHDQIRATQHLVKKPQANAIERFTFALFLSAQNHVLIHPSSELTQDSRYSANKCIDGGISYGKWQDVSYARYRAV